jgi:hypothetical protein
MQGRQSEERLLLAPQKARARQRSRDLFTMFPLFSIYDHNGVHCIIGIQAILLALLIEEYPETA